MSILIPACSMDCFLPSNVCLADNWDLNQSNNRKQAPSDAAPLPGHCAVHSHWALWATQRKGSTLALLCLLSAPKQHWAVGDAAIFTPCHPWESQRFNLSSMKHSSILSAGSLIFSSLSQHGFLFHSVHRDFVSKTRKGINVRVWAGYLCYFSNLNCISIGVFVILWLVFSVPKHLWLTNVCSTLEGVKHTGSLTSHNPPKQHNSLTRASIC